MIAHKMDLNLLLSDRNLFYADKIEQCGIILSVFLYSGLSYIIIELVIKKT